MERTIDIEIGSQPTERTCGATCLHAVYKYYGDHFELNQLIDEIPQLELGGTLGVHLANHALKHGYQATIYTYNLQLFDPTWFAANIDIKDKLAQQANQKNDQRLREASEAYAYFLEHGGKIAFEELSPTLLSKHLHTDAPILTGLSATYLYQNKRERPETDTSDDIAGSPVGHFVILAGIDTKSNQVLVADPYERNPVGKGQYYRVSLERLVGAILLGILTYDANLLVLMPRQNRKS